MNFKNFSLTLVALFALASSASARDFALARLKQAENPSFELSEYANKKTYYEFVRKHLGKKMQAESDNVTRDNEGVLKDGGGVSVKLTDRNFNVHINFPNGPQGGRSYGWTSGQIGDWSDAMYLDNLAEVMDGRAEADVNKFYGVVLKLLGASDADGIDSLSGNSQRVAANFLAIYSAEAYRAMVPSGVKHWDDALFQVTLLGAFHGGQSKFAMYYMGKFTKKTRKQAAGVYNGGRPGPSFDEASEKDAEMKDYWQFSGDPSSRRSGIHLTHRDYEKMGAAITKYMKEVAHDRNVDKIEEIVGSTDNVIEAVALHFSEGNAKVSESDDLAKATAAFVMKARDNADKISRWIEQGNAD